MEKSNEEFVSLAESGQQETLKENLMHKYIFDGVNKYCAFVEDGKICGFEEGSPMHVVEKARTQSKIPSLEQLLPEEHKFNCEQYDGIFSFSVSGPLSLDDLAVVTIRVEYGKDRPVVSRRYQLRIAL